MYILQQHNNYAFILHDCNDEKGSSLHVETYTQSN